MTLLRNAQAMLQDNDYMRVLFSGTGFGFMHEASAQDLGITYGSTEEPLSDVGFEPYWL